MSPEPPLNFNSGRDNPDRPSQHRFWSGVFIPGRCPPSAAPGGTFPAQFHR